MTTRATAATRAAASCTRVRCGSSTPATCAPPTVAARPSRLLATVDPAGRVIKHRSNPLVGAIPGCTAHVRDPKVWSRDGHHWMVLGAQTEDLHGTALLLRSDDLVEWEYLGQVAGGADDPYGYMWECPDLRAPGWPRRPGDLPAARPRRGRGRRALGGRVGVRGGDAGRRHAGLHPRGRVPAGGRRPGLLRPADPHRRLGTHHHGRLDGHARPRGAAGARGEAPDGGQRVGALPHRPPGGAPRGGHAAPVAGRRARAAARRAHGRGRRAAGGRHVDGRGRGVRDCPGPPV